MPITGMSHSCPPNIVKMIIYVKKHTDHIERLRSSDNMVRLF